MKCVFVSLPRSPPVKRSIWREQRGKRKQCIDHKFGVEWIIAEWTVEGELSGRDSGGVVCR